MLQNDQRQAFSLVELATVTVLLGVLATIIIPRVFDGNDVAKTAACHTNKGDIEIQAELWIHNTGSWPLGDLSNIAADVNYFPEGLPTCPVDGSSYTIDSLTGLVIGHNH